MQDINTVSTVMVVMAVILFFLLGVALVVIIDHKAKLPGGFTENPFSIIGMRRDHPVIAFLTTTILFAIIFSLIAELTFTLIGRFYKPAKEPEMKVASLLSEEERIKHFHNLPPELNPLKGLKSACLQCHSDLPHTKRPMVRSMMNMHTQFIGCMTCHQDYNKVDRKQLVMKWKNYSGIKVTGEPFGSAIDEKTGDLLMSDDVYSKIILFKKQGDTLEPVEPIPGTPRWEDLNTNISKYNRQQRAAAKNKFHVNLDDDGKKCDVCHTDESKSLIQFSNLGFSKARIGDLTHMNITGLVGKYDDFYMPDLLGATTKKKSRIRGSEEGKKMADDPRKWWREQYGK